MKSLTIITLIMAIPTVISGIYGMNVSSKWVPLATTAHGFMTVSYTHLDVYKRQCMSR